MAKLTVYEVPTKVMVDQARVLIDSLHAPANKEVVSDLRAQGLELTAFMADFKAVYEATASAEAAQERLKVSYTKECNDDAEVAEQGYRYVLRLQSKGRAYEASVEDDPHDVAGKLRYGKLRVARARGVAYELRIVLPEATDLKPVLEPFGVTDAFLAEGAEIGRKLGVERSESEAARAEVRKQTAELRKQELRLSRLMDRLVTADEAAAMERVDRAPRFTLDIIKAERMRLKAARHARLAARPVSTTTIDE